MKPNPLPDDHVKSALCIAIPRAVDSLASREDRRTEVLDARRKAPRAVGGSAFVAYNGPRKRGQPRIGTVPSQNQGVRP